MALKGINVEPRIKLDWRQASAKMLSYRQYSFDEQNNRLFSQYTALIYCINLVSFFSLKSIVYIYTMDIITLSGRP